ncbi:MAG: ATP-binding protein [Acidobacteriota bacterium]|nr:ATP-binding protein [Acidobacteriota bacterium]
MPRSNLHYGHLTLGLAGSVIMLALAAQAVLLAQPRELFAQAPALETVAAIRERAAWTPSKEVVRVQGVVTLSDGRRALLFVQDATGGVFVDPAAPAGNWAGSDVVAVTGTAVMTSRGPTIVGARVEPVAPGVMPEPRALSALAGRAMAADASLIAIEGVVRAVRPSAQGVEATIRTADGTLTLVLPAPAGAGETPVDAVIRAEGVLSHVMAGDRSLQRRELIATSPVGMVSAPPSQPFQLPELAVADLRRPLSGNQLIRRGRVSGVVTRQRVGRSLHVRTATLPIRVESEQATAVAPGDRVDVVGFPELDGFSPFMADAMFRRVESGPAPAPVEATIGELSDGSRDAELVRVEGTFLTGERGRDEHTLVIQDGDLVFNAYVPLGEASRLPGGLRRGQRVQLTGICAVIVDSDRVPRSFRLQLRDAADVAIVAPGPPMPLASRVPWWAWLSIALAAVAAGAAGFVYRAGRAKEQTIRRQLARESALKARFDDLFERSSEILIVHDRRGRVSTLNRAGEQATGYSREELRMLDPNWIFGADYLDAITRMIAEGTDSTPRAFRSELVPRRGTRVPIDVHARVLVGDGQVVGVTAIARDLSERDRLENELRQAQKMEAVGRLATGIAHDFNNLITVLLGYSDELIEQVPEGSDWQRSAIEIRRAAERASGLTQQLLSFSRRQAAVAHTVDLNLVVANMEDLIRRLLGPEIRLEFSLDPNLATIRADGAQIGQVVMNLVVNARDAMPKGGVLAIETANVELGSEHLDVIPGPHVSLCVRDSGVGMAADVRNRLFEPFFTTKESGQGTGLGLSLVQGIVRQSGGHIVVESQPGAGSAFHVYFPRQVDEAPAPLIAPPAAVSSVSVKGEGTVLLAEDDRPVRRLVVTELGRRGFTVLEAEDGRAALDLFLQHQDTIDIVVTDVVMPRMNGADLAKEVERIRPGTKLLFISGHPERAGSGVDPTGVTNLLMKPFTADTLASRIKDTLSGKKEPDGWNG